jgi:hypothetical protein
MLRDGVGESGARDVNRGGLVERPARTGNRDFDGIAHVARPLQCSESVRVEGRATYQINTHVDLHHDITSYLRIRSRERTTGRVFHAVIEALLEEIRDEESTGGRGRFRVSAVGEKDPAEIGRRGVVGRSDVEVLHHWGRSRSAAPRRWLGARRRSLRLEIRRLFRVAWVHVSQGQEGRVKAKRGALTPGPAGLRIVARGSMEELPFDGRPLVVLELEEQAMVSEVKR